MQGNLAKKTIVRTLKMKDGTEKVLNKTLEKRFELWKKTQKLINQYQIYMQIIESFDPDHAQLDEILQ